MKILHIISSLRGGGRERRMVELVKFLHSKGEEQKIICVDAPGTVVEYPTPDDIDVVYVGGAPSRFETFRRLRREIGLYKPEIVHLWSEVPTILLSVSLLKHELKYKLVCGFLADGNIVKSMSNRIMNRFTYLNSEAIVSNSHAGIIAKKAPLHKSNVIYNGFDFNRLKSDKEASLKLKEEFAIKADEKIVTMVSRFDLAKNWEMFLSLAKMCQDDNLKFRFIAVGKGPTFDSMKDISLSLRLKNVIFTGHRTDVENIIGISDIILQFSNHEVHAEGVSNSILEGMAAGKPVIATDGGGTPEIVANNKSGFLIASNDVQDAYDKLVELMLNESQMKKFGMEGRRIVQENFSINKMGGEYIELYHKIVKY